MDEEAKAEEEEEAEAAEDEVEAEVEEEEDKSEAEEKNKEEVEKEEDEEEEEEEDDRGDLEENLDERVGKLDMNCFRCIVFLRYCMLMCMMLCRWLDDWGGSGNSRRIKRCYVGVEEERVEEKKGRKVAEEE